ncbi:MAG: DMT family transporter [Candidatus Bathyarchaeota archaeon]|nr:DMT family transporter [Candidatus Bathyarchaeota archaeon]
MKRTGNISVWKGLTMTAKSRVLPLAEALLVTFLWSTSYILIEIGLEEINPLAFAAYRYIIASAALGLPTFYRYRRRLMSLSLRRASVFLLLGFTGYFIAQGLQFVGLYYLQPVTVTFILNLTPVFVLVLSVFFLRENPSLVQLGGIALTLGGVLVFFYDALPVFEEVTGILVTLVSGIGWAAYMVLSRHYLNERKENVIVLTVCSMGLGALMLLGTTALTGNIITVSFRSWIILLWLSIVNTAFAFALFNHTLKSLRAYEQSILQNSMLIQIALLSHVFLFEQLVLQKILGMAVVFIGLLIVQLGRG